MVTAEDRARRAINYQNAIQLAKAGVAIFPTMDKVPMVRAFNRLDDEIPPAEKVAIRKDALEKHRAAPVHIGATRRLSSVKKLWHKFPDATPSIAPGPNGLIVIDPDQKNNGPAKFAEFCQTNGGLPDSAVCIPTRDGGQHWYFKNAEGLGNSAGTLKALGCDVKGVGGQVVAPGSIREDGKTYGSKDDLLRFLRAFTSKSLPELPDFVRAAIGSSIANVADNDDAVKAAVERLGTETWPDFSDVFDPTIGKYDLQALALDNREFAELYAAPSLDRSDNRFKVARHLLREWPDMPVEDLAAFLVEWDGAGEFVDGTAAQGEFNSRSIAREWVKNQGLSKPSNGDAFGAVDDDEPADASDANKPDRQKVLFFEDIRTGELKPLVWIVKNFLAKHTTYITAGTWGTGKTAVIMDVALHAACGLEWQGCRVQKAAVIYVALENPFDVERRVRAWSSSMEAAGQTIDDAAFVLHRGPCCLYDPNDKGTRDERALIKLAAETESRYGVAVGLIVIDTVSQALLPGNDRDHAALFVKSIQRIADQTGAAVMALHHPTKAGDPVRGGGEFQGNTDCVMIVERDKSGRGVLRATSKFRIGDPNKARFGYRLRPYVIGKDEDGDDITVVLAVADKSHPTLAAVEDEDDDIPAIKVADRREDRVAMLCDVAKEEAARGAAQDEPLTEVNVTLSALVAGMNGRRSNLCGLDGKPLAPLHKKEVVRVVHSAVEAKRLTARNRGYYWTDLDGDKVGDT